MSLYFLNEGKGGLYASDVLDGDDTASLAFAYFTGEAACVYVCHDRTEEVAVVELLVLHIYKEQVHAAAFEVYLLDAEALGLSA